MTDDKTLKAAITRKMIPIEQAMNRMASRVNWDFNRLTESQQVQHDEWAAEWDRLKADRDLAELVDNDEMTLEEFNQRKRSS
jgi:hypothetical protein